MGEEQARGLASSGSRIRPAIALEMAVAVTLKCCAQILRRTTATTLSGGLAFVSMLVGSQVMLGCGEEGSQTDGTFTQQQLETGVIEGNLAFRLGGLVLPFATVCVKKEKVTVRCRLDDPDEGWSEGYFNTDCVPFKIKYDRQGTAGADEELEHECEVRPYCNVVGDAFVDAKTGEFRIVNLLVGGYSLHIAPDLALVRFHRTGGYRGEYNSYLVDVANHHDYEVFVQSTNAPTLVDVELIAKTKDYDGGPEVFCEEL